MNGDEEREKLLWQVVFEREYCRNWWRNQQQDSGLTACSLNGQETSAKRYAAAKVAGAPNSSKEGTWQR